MRGAAWDHYNLFGNDYENTDTARHSVADERFPPLKRSMRIRRRGPRSMHALIQRKSKHPVRGDLQRPRGGNFGKSKHVPSLTNTEITAFHVNIRGFISHTAELKVHLAMCGMLRFVGITETWLKNSIQQISLAVVA